MLILGLVVALALLIAARYVLSAPQRGRRRALAALDEEDQWWDGRTDVWRYERHHWGWGFRP